MKPSRFHILLALADRERHGLGIMNEVLERTDGALHLWPGMLYGSLKSMVDEGLVIDFIDAKPVVRESAQHAISNFGLDAVLYLIGFSDRDINEALAHAE